MVCPSDLRLNTTLATWDSQPQSPVSSLPYTHHPSHNHEANEIANALDEMDEPCVATPHRIETTTQTYQVMFGVAVPWKALSRYTFLSHFPLTFGISISAKTITNLCMCTCPHIYMTPRL